MSQPSALIPEQIESIASSRQRSITKSPPNGGLFFATRMSLGAVSRDPQWRAKKLYIFFKSAAISKYRWLRLAKQSASFQSKQQKNVLLAPQNIRDHSVMRILVLSL